MKDSSLWDSLPGLLATLRVLAGSRVLIVEDETGLREGLARKLAALGHPVDACEGVERDALPLSGYGVAFLDNYFLSRTLTGVSLTPELRTADPAIRIVGMSSDAGKNAEMVRLGADLAVAKSTMRRLAR